MWFVFSKNGATGSDSITTATFLTETIDVNGESAEIARLDTLTNTDMEKLEAMPPMNSLYPTLSATQIQAMVDAEGDPQVVAAAFNAPQKATPKPTTKTEKPRPAPLPSEVEVTPADDGMAMSEEEMLKHFAR
jgi:hypothetical protein